MVEHPGETEEDFEDLKEFVRKVRFDRMGAAFFVVKRDEWRGKKKIEIGREGAMNLKTVKSDKAKHGFSAIETKRVVTLTFTQ